MFCTATFAYSNAIVLNFKYVTRHAKKAHLGSYVITSEKTFQTSQVLTSFSGNCCSRWLSNLREFLCGFVQRFLKIANGAWKIAFII